MKTAPPPSRRGLNWLRALDVLERERARFIEGHPNAQALSERAARHLLFGVPLHWMTDWPTPFTLQVREAQGARLTDVDGHTLAAMRATLAEVMTPAAYAHMLALAQALADGLRGAIATHNLAWCATQLGARVEFQFAPAPPRNGSAAGAMLDADLERIVHLYLLNRGVPITPFHNMMLVCPQTTPADMRRLLAAFDDRLAEIAA